MSLKSIFYLPVLLFFTIVSCTEGNQKKSIDILKAEIIDTERLFDSTAKASGMQEAFNAFADENAIIKRSDDSLIIGRESIREFYGNPRYKNFDLHWAPDFVDVSEDGTLAYTYGKYQLKIPTETDSIQEYSGIFHTVWKRQKDGKWKYVWD